MHPFIQFKRATPIILASALACVGLSATVQAVSPEPDGGYPRGNTAEGQAALLSLTTGGFNTAVGWYSLRSNTEGLANTAIGAGTLFANTADKNTATGAAALASNTIGGGNTANGAFALLFNTTGGENTATGYEALFGNTTGFDNTANGIAALSSNTTGNVNTATGSGSLALNTTGVLNTANGNEALFSSTIGSANTADGAYALHSNTTGNNNVGLGVFAGNNVITANSVICIGASIAGADVSNTTWIGNIYGVNTQSGTTAPVIVSDNGQLGTIASSERFKKDIRTMEKASEAILALRPVTFHYKSDTKAAPQFGLVAEEVAKVNPALVLPDKEGKPYTVRYDAVNAMLLNEFLKEHRKVEEQQATIAKLKSTVGQQQKEFQATATRQQKQIDALTAGLQKVSAQLELNDSAPRTVLNNQ